MRKQTIAKFLTLGITGLMALGGSAVFAQTSERTASRDTQSNSPLASSVESALQSDPLLKQYDFAVTTQGRFVRIEGAVFTDWEADRAVTIAKRVPGVTKVQNEVQFSATGD